VLILLLIHFAATAFMTGLIWFVQVVHYPLMASVGRDEFVPYERDHTRLTTFVVAPAMLVEAVTAALLLFWSPVGVAAWILWVNALLVLLLWISTATVQVPLHGRLSTNFDEATHRRLVRTNLLRTAIWSGRTLLVGWMLIDASGMANS